MKTIFLYAVVAALLFAAGYIALQRSEIKQKDESIRRLSRYDTLLDGVIMELRDTWDHLPRLIPMDPKWSKLVYGIGRGMPKLLEYTRLTGRDPVSDSLAPDDFAMSSYRFDELDGLVREISDPTLTKLWEQRRLHDLVEILRLALFKTWLPGFDLSVLYMEPKQGLDMAATNVKLK